MTAAMTKAKQSELLDLLWLLHEQRLPAEAAAQLEAWLASDEQARAIQSRFFVMCGLLHWRASERPEVVTPAEPTASPAKLPRQRLWTVVRDFANDYMTLSVVLATLTMTIILLSLALIVPDWGRSTPNVAEVDPPRPAVVARVTATREATWGPSSDANFKNIELFAGERLMLLGGRAEVTFTDGAVVTLDSPVEFIVETSGAGTLQRGKLVAKVNAEAVGFAIHTPLATIVDLGTEFGVTVESDQSASTTVFFGSVLVEQNAPDGTPARKHVVKAGKSVLLEPGRVVEASPEAVRFRYARNVQTSVDHEGNLVLLPTASATVDERGQVVWNGALKTGRDRTGPACASFLHFDLTASPLAADDVESATLKLWLTTAQSFGSTQIHVAAEPWRKPDGRPRLDLPTIQSNYASVASSRREDDVWIPPATGQYYEINATVAVKSWLREPAGNFGLVLHGSKSPTTGKDFNATYREYSSAAGSNPPVLVIKNTETK